MAQLKEGSTVGGKRILDENHLSKKATQNEYGHIRLQDIPKIEKTAIPSDDIEVASAPTEQTSNAARSSQREKLKEIRVNDTGIIRIKYETRSSSSEYSSKTALHKNGNDVTGDIWTESMSYVTVTRDMEVKAGDLVQLYAWRPYDADNTTLTYVRNFGIFYTISLNASPAEIILD